MENDEKTIIKFTKQIQQFNEIQQCPKMNNEKLNAFPPLQKNERQKHEKKQFIKIFFLEIFFI
jgi:hypothetical protein